MNCCLSRSFDAILFPGRVHFLRGGPSLAIGFRGERNRLSGGAKQRVLPDFLIGAHAAVAGFGLITRDRDIGKHFHIEILDPSYYGEEQFLEKLNGLS